MKFRSHNISVTKDAPRLLCAPGPRVRVGGLLCQQGKALLVRQAKGSDTYWLLPGGGVERGESLEQALTREFREEVGLEVEAREPIGLVQTISPDGGVARHVIHLLYRVQVTPTARGRSGGPPAPAAALRDPAILEWQWHEAEALPDLIIHPPIHDLLEKWLQAAAVGEDPLPFLYGGVRWRA